MIKRNVDIMLLLLNECTSIKIQLQIKKKLRKIFFKLISLKINITIKLILCIDV